MIDIGGRIIELRKQHKLSQAELASRIGVSRTIVGNYERNTNTPSIDTLVKMAKEFNVSVDYIIGEGSLASYDREILKRIEDIEVLDKQTKSHLFFLIDNVIQNFKAKKAFG